MGAVDTQRSDTRFTTMAEVGDAFAAFDLRMAELDEIFSQMTRLHAKCVEVVQGLRETEAKQLAAVLRGLTTQVDAYTPPKRHETAWDLVQLDAARRKARAAYEQRQTKPSNH